MKIKAVTLWTPKSAEGVVKGLVYEKQRYVVTESPWKSAHQGNIDVKGIELSPSSEIVLMLHNGDIKVYGYCPYELEVWAEEAAS